MSARQRANQDLTIAINTTDSTALNAKGMASGSVLIPSAFTGTALTFKGSLDGTTWYALYTSADAAVGVGTVAVTWSLSRQPDCSPRSGAMRRNLDDGNSPAISRAVIDVEGP